MSLYILGNSNGKSMIFGVQLFQHGLILFLWRSLSLDASAMGPLNTKLLFNLHVKACYKVILSEAVIKKKYDLFGFATSTHCLLRHFKSMLINFEIFTQFICQSRVNGHGHMYNNVYIRIGLCNYRIIFERDTAFRVRKTLNIQYCVCSVAFKQFLLLYYKITQLPDLCFNSLLTF